VLTVANFNMHAGIDGWGRPFDARPACRAAEADILVLQECWTSDSDAPGQGQAEQFAEDLGYVAHTCVLAQGRRIRPRAEASARWLPPLGLRQKNNSLFFDTVRPLSAAITTSKRFQEAEHGSWGVAVLVRQGLETDDVRTLHLPTLARDRVHRVIIVVDLELDGLPISVVGTHMSHLAYGSHKHYAAARRLLQTEARPSAVLLGDMNLWGPAVRAFLPQWHRAVKGRTWPSWNPHSQIDHVLYRGDLRVVSGEVLPDGGSDHRPVRARLAVR
jgi:endonuclease/exonuclease/phosphatase family metal-dependent hydrolase